MGCRYLIDIGSSTVKVYKYDSNEGLQLVIARTFDLKKDFNNNRISQENKTAFIGFFVDLCNLYGLTKANTKLFATGIFRELADPDDFVSEFYLSTGLYFNIISHDLEAFYLEKAWLGKCTNLDKSLVLNIGGKTTEILMCTNGKVMKKELLPIGVGTIIKRYPSINSQYSAVNLSTIIGDIKKELPLAEEAFPIAIYTGGEQTYMKLAGYPLRQNIFFRDEKHAVCINTNEYCRHNEKVFNDIKLDDLRKLMPENPDWMNGARACSALAQAICSNYSIDHIIPSDSNLIDGVIIQEARNVVLCGSFNRHLKRISKLMTDLRERGISVLSPSNTTVIGKKDGFVLFDGDKMINNCKWTIENPHVQAIKQCDIVIICNFENYVGCSTAYEWGRAASYGKKVVFLENNEVANGFDFPYEIGLL